MKQSENERLKKIKKNTQNMEEIKIIGECIASDDLIDKLSDLMVSSKSKPIAQSEESLKEYRQSIMYAGNIAFQVTPERCKKVKEVPNIPIADVVATGKARGGKCRLLDKTRGVMKKVIEREEIAIKQNGQSKMLKMTKNHKKGFQDSIDEINKLKKQYDCKYD